MLLQLIVKYINQATRPHSSYMLLHDEWNTLM
jgi:hypothetical protein